MIVRVEAYIRKLRRLFSRDVWMARLLRLPTAQNQASEPGLVMIQIDGLAFAQLKRAMQNGNMPFLTKLVKKEGYVNHRHYSGLPSNTPAVQGNLFYGVRGCVPAFSFKSSETGQVSDMFNPEFAQAVENKLKTKGVALLEGGSSYGNIFTGGAAEPHFCASASGWGSLLRAIKPLRISLTILLNLPIFFRALFLMIIEFFISLVDAFRGINAGISLRAEIGFIPMRVAVCVMLREIVTAGAKIDIARGIPIIHLNLAGYDEQAHHRGPSSAFAHWSLRGIDDAIERVWKTAHNSLTRDYDVFIYSDHGQEDTTDYAELHGRTVQEAIKSIFQVKSVSGEWYVEQRDTASSWRLFSSKKNRRKTPSPKIALKTKPETIVTAMGAVGHIYPPVSLTAHEKEKIAAELVSTAKIPFAIVQNGLGKAWAFNSKGKFVLPEQAGQVLESTHPFFDEVAQDLVDLCHHPDAGQIIIFGWKPGKRSVTFYTERGSHAGPGPEETSGFAILPADALSRPFGNKIFTRDLREAAFRAMERGDENAFLKCPADGQAASLKVMTYNVHGCMGRDGKISPNRIARIIARHNPDVVCLQELDTSPAAHQAEIIARKLAMTFQYHSSFSMKTGQRGNAIFSRFPIRPIRNGTLPRLAKTKLLEPRGALWVEIDVCGQKVQILNTHLSLSAAERSLQTEALLGPEWMGNPAFAGPAIFCGDFNSLPNSKICTRIGQVFKNAQFELSGHRVLRTLPSYYPLGSVDHVFIGSGIRVLGIDVPSTRLERISSDHLPLIAELKLPAA